MGAPLILACLFNICFGFLFFLVFKKVFHVFWDVFRVFHFFLLFLGLLLNLVVGFFKCLFLAFLGVSFRIFYSKKVSFFCSMAFFSNDALSDIGDFNSFSSNTDEETFHKYTNNIKLCLQCVHYNASNQLINTF